MVSDAVFADAKIQRRKLKTLSYIWLSVPGGAS